MSDPAATAEPTPKPSRAGRLLNLVRKLIDYGRELVATVRQRAATDPRAIRSAFGTGDIARILAMISRALLRANALEARIVGNAARLDREPRPACASASPRGPRAPRPPAPTEPDPGLDRLPTPEQIAAEIRRRPIGAVIADICFDLGIKPSHELWPEIHHAITMFGGNLVRLVSDGIDRAFQGLDLSDPADPPAKPPAASPPFPAPAGTGPP